MARMHVPGRRSRPDTAGLPAGERALAWADVGAESTRTGEAAATGAHWIGTASALYLPAPTSDTGGDPGGDAGGDAGGDTSGDGVGGGGDTGDVGAVRVPWTRIEQADWEESTQRIRVRELAGFGEVAPVHTERLLGADRLLQLVRERVTAALVHSQLVPSRGGGSFRVMARRSGEPGAELVWSVELPPGADPADPRVTGEAAAALAAVRTQLGVDG